MGEPGVADSQSRYNHSFMWRDVRFEEDHGVGFFLIERSLVRGCVCQVLCHEEVMKER